MAKTLGSLPIGALIEIPVNSGYHAWLGRKIVFKIADKNHAGYPANSVTLITERIIAMRCFDAREPGNANADRRSYGNGRYSYSNIRQWLNSDKAAGAWYSPQHSADTPPSSANARWNVYDTNAGFLNGVSPEFKAALLETTLWVVKAPADDGGSETVTDKIFLASSTEVGTANENGVAEGSKLAMFSDDASRVAYCTPEAVADNNSDNYNRPPDYTSSWHWWLRTPVASTLPSRVRRVFAQGQLDLEQAWYGHVGVRPLCNLSSGVLVSDTANTDGNYTIVWNTPPEPPASITVPTTVRGGASFPISWAESTDADGNLQGYILEREINGSGSWSQIYMGVAASATDYLALNAAMTVRYRVKAYDAEGAESDYFTSESKTVLNNQIPGAPASITVPDTAQGGKPLAISWGAAIDPDGNLEGYLLDRSVDGGTFTQIADTTGRTFTDNITKGWLTVAYRVRAYDTYNDFSNYTTSSTRTVDNTSPPIIESSLSGDLGTKAEGFTVPYTITDVDGGTVTVTETLDGATLRTYTASLGEATAADLTDLRFMTILNGNRAIKITAKDETNKTAELQLTFTKAVHELSITLAEPIIAAPPITRAVINVTQQIPLDAEFKVELTNNANDPAPIWEDATSAVIGGFNHLFTNTLATNGPAFNVRVTARRGPSGQGGHIISIGGAFE